MISKKTVKANYINRLHSHTNTLIAQALNRLNSGLLEFEVSHDIPTDQATKRDLQIIEHVIKLKMVGLNSFSRHDLSILFLFIHKKYLKI